MKNGFMAKVFDYLLIFFGTLFMSIALNVFFEPNNIVIGGATGVAVIIKYLTKGIFDGGISLGVSNLAVNIPLFWYEICRKNPYSYFNAVV